MLLNLTPLIETIKQVDGILSSVEQGKAGSADRLNLQKALMQPIDLGQKNELSLSRPADLAQTLFEKSDGQIGLQIRQRKSTGPCYFLYRSVGISKYPSPLILDDFYMSESFSFDDPVLFPISTPVGEKRYLRLTDYRQKIQDAKISKDEESFDALLVAIGSGPLGAAIHPDQLLARAVSRAFGLPHFLQAVEACYFLLCARLSLLKNLISPEMTHFFKNVYPNQPIAKLLEIFPKWTGKEIVYKRRQAKETFSMLSASFRTFLDSKVVLKIDSEKRSLGKLVFANYRQLDMFVNQIRDDSLILQIEKIETESKTICKKIAKE